MSIFKNKKRFCPICEKSFREFKPFGKIQRKSALCENCGALERHRFLWIYLQKETDFFNNSSKIILHIAPEKCFQVKLEGNFGDNYITADLLDPSAKVKMDISNIQYPDQYFDIIICNHVLEHIEDDKKAIREFYRVLKFSGWAILNVPISREKTFEDRTITNPQERLKAFGQEDHLRVYGKDYIDRLIEGGFKVNVIKVNDIVSKEDAILQGLTVASGEIYHCTK